MVTGFVASGDDDYQPDYPVTERWRALVRARISEMEISQAELARRIGHTPASVTNILRDNRSSSLIPDIHRVLGWPPPPLPEDVVPTEGTRDVKEFAAIGRQLPDDLRASTLAYLRSVLESRRKR